MIEYSSACFSKGKPDWGTPPKLFEELSKEFGPFKLDPCTTKFNPLGTPSYCCYPCDGLIFSWEDPTYVNPPYGKGVIDWIVKASNEAKLGRTVVMLLPARTDTKWFHDYCYNKDNVEIRFLRGRQKMIDMDDPHRKPNTAPFPSMIVIFHPK